ncbi:hypothetical protein E3V33_05285 [Candidatus Marinimicrobia bacterium MT.SAG.4]|nr:hypothetical protein E3V33_05285 [Candidatus Marinimicrobia bacterium MT.SAG.4]
MIIIVVSFTLLISCSKITKEEKEWGENGTVNLGFCWLILSEEGIMYEPINLDEDFKSKGLQVKFTFKERTDMVSICMQGRIIEIIRIEKQ